LVFLKEAGVSIKTRKWARFVVPLWLALIIISTFVPRRTEAIPQFARRYNLKCYACHTIPPVLNENGYLFKRLGYHLPPALQKDKPAPKISELVKKEPEWRLTNNAALAVVDGSFSAERTTAEGATPSSTSAFQVGAWNAYFAGWVPDTNFFYYGEFDIVTGGKSDNTLRNANFGYAGGTAKSSWYADVGRRHLQVAEGTRAAAIYSLLPSPPLLFENMGPTNFIFDQSPVGVELAYTWASPKYKNVLAATLKVTNGDNADGSEILGPADRNSKDVWFDADWWFAPESGVTFLNYYGRKDQTQNSGQPNEFSFTPIIRRQGIFANYMLRPDKVDSLGGYMHGRDDWLFAVGGPSGSYLSNAYFGEVDYYIRGGLAVVGRYDGLHQKITGGVGPTFIHDWTVGAEKAFTPSGNIVGRLAYSYKVGRDPVSALRSTDKLFQADIAFNF
jgi:hypothetical protein